MKDVRSTVYVVTYCSRDKDQSPGLLPAVDRYLSSRIGAACAAASMLETGFRILSGLYGLLEQDQEIPSYDHLLTIDKIPAHVRLLEQQLRKSAAERVIFITRTLAVDPGTGPYREAMRQACAGAGVGFEVLETGRPELSPAELADLIRPLLG